MTQRPDCHKPSIIDFPIGAGLETYFAFMALNLMSSRGIASAAILANTASVSQMEQPRLSEVNPNTPGLFDDPGCKHATRSATASARHAQLSRARYYGEEGAALIVKLQATEDIAADRANFELTAVVLTLSTTVIPSRSTGPQAASPYQLSSPAARGSVCTTPKSLRGGA